jgi:hypothetical protein
VVVLLAIFLSFQQSLSAQSELPDIPDLIRVTVDHTDHGFLIQWEPSLDLDIAAYNIYRRQDLVFQLVSSVPPDIFEYKAAGDGSRNPAFAVTAVDSASPPNESLFEDNVHRAVSAAVLFDPCTPANVISWQPYEGWEGNISAYQIFVREEGGDFYMLDFVSASTLSYIHSDITTGQHYDYYITTVHTSGTISQSDIVSVASTYPEPPGLLTLDQVSVLGSSEAEITFSADVSGEINDFRVMKRTQPGAPYSVVATILNAGSGQLSVTDQFPTSAEHYEYLVQSLYMPPSCPEPIVLSESNPGTNVLLTSGTDNQFILLSWTLYDQFPGSLSGYAVERRTGNGDFIEVDRVGPGVTSWQETIGSLTDGSQSGEMEYRVVALESGGDGESRSNIVAVQVETSLEIPNAFTPGSNDMNFEFRPFFDFAPRDYMMIILDRAGRKLFETSDPGEGWDGRARGGDFVTEGVYVYHIQFTDFTGRFTTRTGNVTVLYP